DPDARERTPRGHRQLPRRRHRGCCCAARGCPRRTARRHRRRGARPHRDRRQLVPRCPHRLDGRTSARHRERHEACHPPALQSRRARPVLRGDRIRRNGCPRRPGRCRRPVPRRRRRLMLNLSSAARLDAAAFGIDVSDVDSWVSARRDGDRIALVRESGAIDHLTVTAVGQGVGRVRSGAGSGESSMLSGAAETALPVVADGDSLTAGHGAIGVRVTSDAHLQLGALASTSGDGSMGGSGLRPGALTADGDTIGWLARFAMTPTASVFGGGESVQGPQLRGRTRVMRNVETSGFTAYDRAYLNVAFIWSPEGWGLLVHTGGTVTMDIGDTAGDVLSVMWRGGELDLFVFEGTPHEILSRYHRVTGEPGTVPGWALGTWMSRCSY